MHSGRIPCEDEGRGWSNASTKQGITKITSKPSEARGEAWNGFSVIALRKNQLCQDLNLRFLASRTVRQYISVVKATQFVVLCYGSPSKYSTLHPTVLP